DGHAAGRIVGEDHGGQRPGRELGLRRGGQRVDLREGAAGIDVVAIVVADDAAADDRARFLLGGAGGLAGPAFQAVGQVLLDRAGGHAAIEGQHLHGGVASGGQDVDGNRGDGQAAEDEQRQSEDDDRVPVAQRELDQAVHSAYASFSTGAATTSLSSLTCVLG